MTKAFKNLSRIALFGAVAFSVASCADEYSMPSPNIDPAQLVEGVAFTVEHDSENPNIIHLKSLMPAQYNVAWITPQGRRNTPEATLQIPFDGSYEVQLGVDTRGGYVWSDPYTFTVDDFCAEFVDHYLWTRLSGGVGNSKTWQLDLGVLDDGSVKTVYWNGPHWYWNPNYTWDHLHAAIENENVYFNYRDFDDDNPWDQKALAINPAEIPSSDGEDNANWYWPAEYGGNTWMCEAKNYGYITFDLINGANVTISDADGNVIEKGTYLIDTENHTISFSGVYPLNSSNNGVMTRDCKILYLSDTAMQMIGDGIKAGTATSVNYVTKDYFENYSVPKPTEIELPKTWAQDFATQNNYCTWRLNERAPFDWYDLGGEKKNGFKGVGDYPGNLTPDDGTIAEFRLDFNNPATGKYVVTLPGGDTIEGDYSLVDNGQNGYISLSDGIGSTALGGSAVKIEGNQLTVISVGYDDLGRMSDVVLGIPQKDVNGTVYEYLGYQFTADYGIEQKKNYRMSLQYFNTGWAFSTQDIYIENPGTYTMSIDFADDAPYGVFLDCYKILDDYPNCDIFIDSIKVDGNDIGMPDDAISRGVGDADNIARRYILNPWNDDSASWTPKFVVTQNLSVTITVSFENGTPFVPEPEE
ncbi:MAG: hypothetical protein K2H72_09770 [Muribaculaceae bacterium]|nr:hypothetical protein [Muribaculaceae bacterium]